MQFCTSPWWTCKKCDCISLVSNDLFQGGEANVSYIYSLLWGMFFAFIYFNWIRWLSIALSGWIYKYDKMFCFVFNTHWDPWVKLVIFFLIKLVSAFSFNIVYLYTLCIFISILHFFVSCFFFFLSVVLEKYNWMCVLFLKWVQLHCLTLSRNPLVVVLQGKFIDSSHSLTHLWIYK